MSMGMRYTGMVEDPDLFKFSSKTGASALLGQMGDEVKDGFLYINYNGESTFG